MSDIDWTEANNTDPQGNWGQGASNNDSGWGQGAVNNIVSWGWAHVRSLGHAITNLIGLGLTKGYTFYLKSNNTSPLNTANALKFTAANFSYALLTTAITLMRNNWYVDFIPTTLGGTTPLLSYSGSTFNSIQIRANGAIRVINNGIDFTSSYFISANKIYRIEATAIAYNLYEGNVLVDTFGDGGTSSMVFDAIGVLGLSAGTVYSDNELAYLDIDNKAKFESTGGEGSIWYDSISGNNATFTNNAGSNPTWSLGVATIFEQ